MSTVAENLAAVRKRIAEAELKYQRRPGEVQLIAVSKTKPAEALLEARDAGQRLFGENYLQEALDKQVIINRDDIEWHFIGPIQSNKTRQIAESFAWVHGVDREKIARRLSEQRPAELSPLNICLQVNVSNEESKSGVSLDDLPALLANVIVLPGLRVRGLMAIPQRAENVDQQRAAFATLAEALQMLNQQYQIQMDTLSMGMSGDLEAAIAEGATMVRVGTDIFGAR